MDGNIVNEKAELCARYAVWLYDGGMTRAFFTSTELDAEEAASVRAAGDAKALELGGAWECHFRPLREAVAEFASETPEDMVHLYEDGIGEKDLLQFFGEGRPTGRNLPPFVIAAWLRSLYVSPDGLTYGHEVSDSLGTSVATLCAALRELLKKPVGDVTTPTALASMREAVDKLHEEACSLDPGELTYIPRALLPTVRKVNTAASVGAYKAVNEYLDRQVLR